MPVARAVFSSAVMALLGVSLPMLLSTTQDSCGTSEDEVTPTPGTPTATPDSTEEIPRGTVPCRKPEYWPHQLASSSWPILVHYRTAEERATAEEVLGYMEYSWQVETQQLGFRPPLEDTGACGPDGRFDVFLWKGLNTCYANAITDNPETEWDDAVTYIVVDPWGDYGGAILDSTLAHEFNHACQAADDWWDSPIVFEMTATLIEDAVYDDDNEYTGLFYDFQDRPDWALDWNDNYRTWYMYGASLYFFYLNDRFFDGDFSFAGQMWLNMRNPPGAQNDPTLNEPDFEDALDTILLDKAGVSFLDSVLEFARWRWYVGAQDDGLHFAEGDLFPADATVAAMQVDVSSLANRSAAGQAALDEAGTGTQEVNLLTALSVAADPAPMALGNVYMDLEGTPGQSWVAVSLQASAEVQSQVRLVVQALPGLTPGTDGELLAPSSSPWKVQLTPEGTRTLVITALPVGENDPDTRTNDRFPFSLTFGM